MTPNNQIQERIKPHHLYQVGQMQMYFLSFDGEYLTFYHYVQTVRGREILYFREKSIRLVDIKPVKKAMLEIGGCV